MLENFFKTYTEIVFAHFDPELIIQILEFVLNGLKDDPTIKTHSCNALQYICSFVYETMNKTTEKSKILKAGIQRLMDKQGNIFPQILKTILKSAIYEESKTTWVY